MSTRSGDTLRRTSTRAHQRNVAMVAIATTQNDSACQRLTTTPGANGASRKARPVPSITACAMVGSSSSVDLWMRPASRS
jgi:hypothetical protein